MYASYSSGSRFCRFATFLLALFLPAAAWAGQVRGRVVDPSDAALPGVALTLANDLTDSSQQTTGPSSVSPSEAVSPDTIGPCRRTRQ